MRQHVERAIHRRFVEARNVPSSTAQDFWRGQMLVGLAENGDNGFTLRRQTIARLAQIVEERMFQSLLFPIATSCNKR